MNQPYSVKELNVLLYSSGGSYVNLAVRCGAVRGNEKNLAVTRERKAAQISFSPSRPGSFCKRLQQSYKHHF